jgi:hypothetical protein
LFTLRGTTKEITMPDDPEPEGIPPIFERPSMSPDFAADLLARVYAQMAALGLQREMMTPLETEAVQIHVVFQALVTAGFTEDQAIKYLAWRPS